MKASLDTNAIIHFYKAGLENIIFSIGIKVLVLILASLGLANMWLAIFADVGVTVLATLNAMRTMKLT